MPTTEDVMEMETIQTPNWLQGHEHRLTKNEKDIEKLQSDISDLKGDNKEFKDDIKELKDILNKSNTEQVAILNEMNKQMRDEFFKKKSTSHAEKWKIYGVVVGGIVSGGGVLTTMVVFAFKFLGGN